MSDAEIIATPAGPARLKRSNRRTLAISVLADGSLELAAPARASIAAIITKVEKRGRWIRAQRWNFSQMNAARPRRRYVSGATHMYLGRQYRLKISRSPTPRLTLNGGYFHFVGPKTDEGSVKAALQNWYRERAREQFEKRVRSWEEWCKNRKLPAPRMRLRTMPKRWGSACKDGTIALNPELIRAPSACVDYVITHEICHLKHPDHGPRFRALLQQLCPDWVTLKARLEKSG